MVSAQCGASLEFERSRRDTLLVAIAVLAFRLVIAQATGHPGNIIGPTSQIPSRTRTGRYGVRSVCSSRTSRGSTIRQSVNHEVGGARRHARAAVAGVPHLRARTPQAADQQLGQWTAAMHPNRRRSRATAEAHRGARLHDPQQRGQISGGQSPRRGTNTARRGSQPT